MGGARVSSNSCRNVRRSIDRRGSLKIGARASSMSLATTMGLRVHMPTWGLVVLIGYRLLEPIGFEVGYSQYAPERWTLKHRPEVNPHFKAPLSFISFLGLG